MLIGLRDSQWHDPIIYMERILLQENLGLNTLVFIYCKKKHTHIIRWLITPYNWINM